MTNPHTLRSFDDALNGLVSDLLDMAAQVQDMLAEAGDALLDGNLDLARRVVERDLAVDQQFETIRAQCMEALVRFHPVAADLRQVMAIEHSAGNLERAADHAKGIAKRVIAGANGDMSGEASTLLQRLHAAVMGALSDASGAFKRRDPDLAQRVIRGDRQIDRIHDDLFHLVLAGLKPEPGQAGRDIHLLFVAKSLERIGDHATNLAEEALFMARGEAPSATRTD